MERWRGRVAVVTGASVGIGAAIAYQLQDAGVHVVALARRAEQIPEAVEAARQGAKSRQRESIGKTSTPGTLHCLKCDLSNEEDILSAFEWVKKNTNGVDILVNNAGLGGTTKLSGPERNTEEWRKMLNINVLALSICTREAVQQMRTRGVDDGQIVHICSDAGHWMPVSSWPGWAMYFATKHSVRVLTEGLRKELVAAKSGIRVSEVSPGLVRTDFFDTLDELDLGELWRMPYLFPEDVADAVLKVVEAPAYVQIHEIIIKPTGEEF